MRHGGHAVHAEQIGEEPHHHLAVFQHVAYAAGHTQVVLQHVILALAFRVGRTHDVDACNLRINLVGHIHAHHLGAKLRIALDLLQRHDARFDDFLVVVDVMDEAVERRDALHQALLHALPLVRRDRTRNQVKRDQALSAAIGPICILVLRAIDGKGDADTTKDHLRLFTALAHHVAGLLGKPGVVALVMVANLLPLREELVGQLGVHLVKLVHGNWLRAKG